MMQSTAQQILDILDAPEALEALYRQNPESFRDSLDKAARTLPDSTTLQVWQARLRFKAPSTGAERSQLWYAIAIGLCVGALVRIPAIWLGEEWFYPRLAPSLVILSLAAYFWREDRDRRQLIIGVALTLIAIIYASLLPTGVNPETALVYTDSVVMALIHLPILFWAFLGWVFIGAPWRDPAQRILFVRYNGEMLILVSLVGLGGLVFSFITVVLFDLIFQNTEEAYFRNAGVVGAAAVPIAATYLYDVVFKRRTGIASALARVFVPLFLIMTTSYLMVAFASGQDPFIDRSFLITFNALLLVVLGMTVFSIAARDSEADVGWIDYINLALLIVTLLIDLIALSAILFRLSSYGFTPNRVVVLGANLVVMTHLAWMGRAYIGLVRAKGGADGIRRAVAGYLPVYAAWAAFVTFVLPFVFRYS
jgi:hypothetical protein